MTGDKLKRSMQSFALSAIYLLGLLWIFLATYADWLRFQSPRQPNPATGQIVFEKASRGSFYITAAQSLLVQKSLPFVWLFVAGCFFLLWRLGRRENKADMPSPAESPISIMLFGFAFLVWIVAAPALLFFGDHVMALLFTGSLSVPPERH